MKIAIDPEDLTLDELEALDDLLPGGFKGLTDGDLPVRALRVIAYLVLKRTNPDVTLEDLGSLKLSEFDLGDDQGEGDAATT